MEDSQSPLGVQARSAVMSLLTGDQSLSVLERTDQLELKK